ncbi:MAG: hypothetical protein LIQ30_04800 [Planctomycetes bacterium]|nr:hypothetical protein [Planctomycetota bacterium]MCC8115644.1 hypothetical protein [Planctomycetota bacterium]
MYTHEVRWFVLLPLAVILGVVQVFLEVGDVWFGFPARPDWLWILAFVATLRTTPVEAIGAFALCGLTRDLFLGPRLGSGTFAFVLIGWVAIHWRLLATTRGWLFQILIAALSAFLVALVRHGLDYGWLTYKLMERWFFVSMADGLLTGVGYLPLALVLGLSSFRPWKTRSSF